MTVPTPTGDPDPGEGFLGASAAAQEVRRQIRRAAAVDVPVLILGESGVGKELVARQIHAASERRSGPFIPINCSAIPETLIETELFGHEPGAFTDARGPRRGAFELAAGGVLFLDEVADLSRAAQPKLLRAIELGEIRPVGGEQARRVDLRIVAATNRNLRLLRRRGDFRADLYFRLDILQIRIPPLRERIEDVPILLRHLCGQLANGERREPPVVTHEALKLLMGHTWPGNVRELRGAVERAAAMNPDRELDAGCFALDMESSPGLNLRRLLQSDWRTARHDFERHYVLDLLRRHGGNVQEAARAAGLSVRSVYKILERVGLNIEDVRE